MHLGYASHSKCAISVRRRISNVTVDIKIASRIVGVIVANCESETSITSDETRGNKRLSPPRTTDNPQTRLPPSSSLSITFSSRTRNEIMSDVLDATELFTSDVIQLLYSTVPYSMSALLRVRYCVYIS